MAVADLSEAPLDGLAVAIELAQIASGPGSTKQRASALLVVLGRLIPFAGATVQVLDPERCQLRSLASTERARTGRVPISAWVSSLPTVAGWGC